MSDTSDASTPNMASGFVLQPPVEVPRVAVAEPLKPVTMKIGADRDGVEHISLPPGWTTASTEAAAKRFQRSQPNPQRRTGWFVAADVSSFLSWMKHNCDEDAPVFADGAESLATDWKTPQIFLKGIGNYSAGEYPGWHDFGASYQFPVTKAWEAWAGNSGRWMTQAQFSEFVEGHLYEFSEPQTGEVLGEAITRMIEALGGTKRVATPGAIYELSNGIKITVNEQIEVKLDNASGQDTLSYAQAHTGKGGRPLAIPKFFYIRVPIFFGQEPSLIGALLRYRSNNGSVTWSYELFAPDIVVRDAFNVVCEAVEKAGRTLYLGAPDTQES